MKYILISILTLTASGCAYVPLAVDKGAKLNDEAVKSAEFTICNAASIGSIRRAYGDRIEVWKNLCSQGNRFEPIN